MTEMGMMGMVIKTSKGKTHEVTLVSPALRDRNIVLIELKDERSLSEIAADLDGLTAFREQEDEQNDGVYKTYENFSELISVKRDKKRGAVIVTLERGEENGDVHT